MKAIRKRYKYLNKMYLLIFQKTMHAKIEEKLKKKLLRPLH